MRLLSSYAFVIVLSSAAAVVVNHYSDANVDNNIAVEQTQTNIVKSYILQGDTPERLNRLVKGVGGNVSREFPIINAISALLTQGQADIIRESGSVRIQDDRTVVTSSLISGKIASYTAKQDTINNYISEQTGADLLHDMNITGEGVTVAVIDSGANMWGSSGSHLFRDSKNRQRVAIKYDATKGRETRRYNDDKNGHGSHVSGLVASSINDNTGKFNGIAPDVYLLSVKAFDSNGQSSYSQVLDSLNWIFENRYKFKIRVVNLSLGAEVQSHYWDDPINLAVMRLWDAGIVVVSSAGNNGEDMGITVPGNTPYIITVGAATDSGTPYDMTDDRLATFSAKGPTYEGFVKPEVVAYGASIASKLDERYLSKVLKSSETGDHYSEISGTSQAAAIVSGVAALIISNDPSVTPDEVKCRIMQTAVPAQTEKMATYSPFEQGAGLVNAYEAVMSSATNCANTGLNIKEDLLGVNHFVGPAVRDVNGDFAVELADGSILTKGLHWGGDELVLEGLHWVTNDITLKGLHWNNSGIALKGLHWEGDISLEGLHWESDSISLEGLHWIEGSVNLQSADLDLKPIDPSVEIPISSDSWN